MADATPPAPPGSHACNKATVTVTKAKQAECREETSRIDSVAADLADQPRGTTWGNRLAMIDTGDTAWLLAASALVLLMAPGLALFYGGMVRSKSVLNMMMMTFGALGAVTVVWAVLGYSLAFGDDLGLGLIGDPRQYLGLSSLMEESANGDSTVPLILFAAFQGLFAVITGALISGAIADRARFGTWMVFVSVWTRGRLRPGSALGLRLRPCRTPGRLDGQHARARRLRRGHRRGDLLRRLRARGCARGRASGGLRPGPDAPAQPDPGDARRWSALVRLVRVQRRLRARRQPHRRGRLREHPARRMYRRAGVALGRTAARRARHLARRRLRSRGRPGRDHPELRVAVTGRGDADGRAGGRGLRAGRRPEVHLRVRRLPGRRGRAPRRRAGGYLRHRPARDGGCSRRRGRAVLRRGCGPARQAAARWLRRAGVRVRGLLRPGQGAGRDDGLPRRRGARSLRDRPRRARGDGVRPARHRGRPQRRHGAGRQHAQAHRHNQAHGDTQDTDTLRHTERNLEG